jgi:hypothetical protein
MPLLTELELCLLLVIYKDAAPTALKLPGFPLRICPLVLKQFAGAATNADFTKTARWCNR